MRSGKIKKAKLIDWNDQMINNSIKTIKKFEKKKSYTRIQNLILIYILDNCI